LHQNTPNPFNPTTVIRYDVPAAGGNVTLRIYDVAGRLIRTLVDGAQTSGQKSVTWQATDDLGSRVGSGVYFYHLRAPGFSETRKMVLVQ
jgi:flagellar hook assembly protein FlgD